MFLGDRRSPGVSKGAEPLRLGQRGRGFKSRRVHFDWGVRHNRGLNLVSALFISSSMNWGAFGTLFLKDSCALSDRVNVYLFRLRSYFFPFSFPRHNSLLLSTVMTVVYLFILFRIT